ncbi:MAG: DUF4013 domain-containing protein [Planctomycetia bacterium]|nr:DUF4013 domain-containing protein [Planctomycetia bacterium]
MAEGDQISGDAGPARRIAPAADMIDYGVSPLHVESTARTALEVTQFLEPGFAPAGTATDPVEITDYLDGVAPDSRPKHGLIRRTVVAALGFVAWLIQSLFGIASLILLLALIAAIPIVNLLALGYLLEVEGRMARSGKLRDAFPLLRQAPRLGSIALGIWAWIIPLRLLSNAAADARLIDPGSFADVSLHIVVTALAVLVTVHLCLALAHGGSLWAFMWPLALPLVVAIGGLLLLATARYVLAGLLLAVLIAFAVHRGRTLEWLNALVRGWAVALYRHAKEYLAYLRSLLSAAYWNHASTTVSEFVTSLRLKHHFLLGFKGFVGALIWLLVPTAIFAAARKTEGGPILMTLFGGALLMLVLSWVPFLQAHYSAENRFGAMFELGTVRKLFKNAPFSWMVIMLVTLTMALPMYLFKVRLPPSDALWMETIVFIVTIYPVKVITGWAYHRALTRERRAFFGLRWLTRLVLLPFLATYVFLLFFTQFIGQHGKLVLFEHHAFLLPAPFGLF